MPTHTMSRLDTLGDLVAQFARNPRDPEVASGATGFLARDDWHTLSVDETLRRLKVEDPGRGLAPAEVPPRRAVFGANQLAEGKQRSSISIIIEQFLNVLTLILAAVFVIAVVNQEWVEAVVVLVIILVNSTIAAWQEIKSESAMAAIRNLALARKALVVRNGATAEIEVADLVVGDIVILQHGGQVPADIRLTQAVLLEVDEAILTGESLPVTKSTDPIRLPIPTPGATKPGVPGSGNSTSTVAPGADRRGENRTSRCETPVFPQSGRESRAGEAQSQESIGRASLLAARMRLPGGGRSRAQSRGEESQASEPPPVPRTASEIAVGDRTNMVFRQTTVSQGSGRGVVVAVGSGTQIGKIADRLAQRKKEKVKTPLTRSMNKLMYCLFLLGIIFGVFVFWAFKWEWSDDALLYASATLVAILPECAIVLITVSMAMGARRMVQQHAIVRKLAALEQLGRVTDICSDKTGTLTMGVMQPARLILFTRHHPHPKGAPAVQSPRKTEDLEDVGATDAQSFAQPGGSRNNEQGTALGFNAPPPQSLTGGSGGGGGGDDLFAASLASGGGGAASTDAGTAGGALGGTGKLGLVDVEPAGVSAPGSGPFPTVAGGLPAKMRIPLSSQGGGGGEDTPASVSSLRVSGPPRSRVGAFSYIPSVGTSNGVEVDLKTWIHEEQHRENTFKRCMLISALCSTTRLRLEGLSEAPRLAGGGNPTEVALQELVHKACFAVPGLDAELWDAWEPRGEWAFNSSVKRMSMGVRHREYGGSACLTKGALEFILPLCTNISKQERSDLARATKAAASEGLRVLALAYRIDIALEDRLITDYPREEVERDLHLAGLVAVRDPPKPESAQAVQECKQAGITVRMLTGDHPDTAVAIAREIGILPTANTVGAIPVPQPPGGAVRLPRGMVLTGVELERMTEEELDNLPDLPLVVARSSPESKVRVVQALHRRKRVVAMTGDGVNDSPALKEADVGVAMGIAGSDVTKGVADIVLSDDNFATIVNAVREGRRIFDSITQFVMHLMTSNAAEAVIIMIALSYLTDAEDLPVFVLSPLAILYINTATDSGPTVGLAMDIPAPDLMIRPPIRHGVFTLELVCDFMVYGVFMGALVLAAISLSFHAWNNGDSHATTGCNTGNDSPGCDAILRARGTAFLLLNALLLIHAYNCRHKRLSFLALPILANRVLLWSVVIGTLAAVPILYVPWLNDEVFKHKGPGWEWGMVFAACIIFMAMAEAYKAVKRRILPPLGDENKRISQAHVVRAEQSLPV